MPEIPFSMQWPIAENRLLSLKGSVNGHLFSTSALNIPKFEYYLAISPNGDKDERRGQTWIFLQLKFKNVKKVEADYTFTIESANVSKTDHYVYVESYGWGTSICSTEKFYDPKKKFIVDGKFIVKVNGTFKFETALPAAIGDGQQTWIGGELGDELWERNDTKDFAIIVGDGKEIKVDKFILRSRSDFFKELLNTCAKDSSLEINEFLFNVVETALKIIYDCNFTTFLSINELMELQQFFDKYLLPAFKARVEPLLISQISASTVCRLTNCSIKTNSTALKNSCIEYLMASFASKTALSDIEILDKTIALQILQNSLPHNISTEQAVIEGQQRWNGGELGDQLWVNNDIKDFAIITDDGGKRIEVHKFILRSRSDFFEEHLIAHPNDSNLEILDFPFNVVETAIKIIYNCNFTTELSIDELMELLQFFDQYQLSTLKTKVEPFLIAYISAANVCRLTNCSIFTNSIKLKEKCIEFLMAAFESKTALADIEILNKDIALKILQNSLYQTLETKED